MKELAERGSLEVITRVNGLENVRSAFAHRTTGHPGDRWPELDLYKRITDAPSFGEVSRHHLFGQYLRTHWSGDAVGCWHKGHGKQGNRILMREDFE